MKMRQRESSVSSQYEVCTYVPKLLFCEIIRRAPSLVRQSVRPSPFSNSYPLSRHTNTLDRATGGERERGFPDSKLLCAANLSPLRQPSCPGQEHARVNPPRSYSIHHSHGPILPCPIASFRHSSVVWARRAVSSCKNCEEIFHFTSD